MPVCHACHLTRSFWAMAGEIKKAVRPDAVDNVFVFVFVFVFVVVWGIFVWGIDVRMDSDVPRRHVFFFWFHITTVSSAVI